MLGASKCPTLRFLIGALWSESRSFEASRFRSFTSRWSFLCFIFVITPVHGVINISCFLEFCSSHAMLRILLIQDSDAAMPRGACRHAVRRLSSSSLIGFLLTWITGSFILLLSTLYHYSDVVSWEFDLMAHRNIF